MLTSLSAATAGFAILILPDGPLGRSKVPLSVPRLMAVAMSESKPGPIAILYVLAMYLQTGRFRRRRRERRESGVRAEWGKGGEDRVGGVGGARQRQGSRKRSLEKPASTERVPGQRLVLRRRAMNAHGGEIRTRWHGRAAITHARTTAATPATKAERAEEDVLLDGRAGGSRTRVSDLLDCDLQVESDTTEIRRDGLSDEGRTTTRAAGVRVGGGVQKDVRKGSQARREGDGQRSSPGREGARRPWGQSSRAPSPSSP